MEQLETLIREGKIEEARNELLKLTASTPFLKQHRSQSSHFAARVGLPELGLKWLRPLVLSTQGSTSIASPAETAEYALCLVRVGALSEAKRWLNTLDSKTYGKIDFYQFLAHIGSWNYIDAIPYLERYIKNNPLSDYEERVAHINLASALVVTRDHQRAETILRDLREKCRQSNQLLLFSNANELTTANFIYQKDYSAAEKSLQVAETILGNAPVVYSLLIRKWRAVLHLAANNAEPLQHFRQEVIERGHWESVRECDRFLAVISHDKTALWRAYFGTPFKSYREMLLKDFGENVSVPEVFNWEVRSGESGRHFSSVQSLWSSERKPHLKALELLLIFTSDFYRPFQIATLYEKLYPGEFFNPVSSSKRVHASIARLRLLFKEWKVPFDVAEEKGLYRLTALSPATLELQSIHWHSPLPLLLLPLEAKVRETPFSASWGAEQMGISLKTLLGLLAEAVQMGFASKIGLGRATRYQFLRPQ